MVLLSMLLHLYCGAGLDTPKWVGFKRRQSRSSQGCEDYCDEE